MYLMYLICSLALVITIPKILKICGYLFERRLHRLKFFFARLNKLCGRVLKGRHLIGQSARAVIFADIWGMRSVGPTPIVFIYILGVALAALL